MIFDNIFLWFREEAHVPRFRIQTISFPAVRHTYLHKKTILLNKNIGKNNNAYQYNFFSVYMKLDDIKPTAFALI